MAGYVLLAGQRWLGKKATGEALSEFLPGYAGRESGGPPHRIPDRFFNPTTEN